MTLRAITPTSTCFPTSQRPTGILRRIARAYALHRSRKDLSGLTDAQLADIGVSHVQAEKEAARPFWDAPDHWKA